MNNCCTLCAELSDKDENNLCFSIFNRKINRILKETENFVVLPSIGQIVEGYLLIVPKKHYLCIGAMPTELFKEFVELKKEVIHTLFKIYGKRSILFEHGSVGKSFVKKAGCCTDHAHLHIIPVNEDLFSDIAKDYVGKEIHSLIKLRKNWLKKEPYLFYENNFGKMFVFDAKLVVSQYCRMLLTKKLHLNNWDWRRYPGKAKMLNTIKKLRGYFNEGTNRRNL